jgi:hypothetical protein
MLKNALIFVVAFGLLVGFAYYGLNSRRPALNRAGEPQVTETVEKEPPVRDEEPVAISFTETSTVAGEEEGIAVIDLDEGEVAPTAFTLMMSFDPAKLKVIKVEVGDIWVDANVLQDDVDNTAGTIEYSAGQAFNTEVTGGREVAKIYYEKTASAGSGPVTLTLEEGSSTAYVGVDVLVPFNNLPRTLTVD